MTQYLMYSNKQMRYKMVLLIQINDVQQKKVQKQMKVLWTLNMQVRVLWNFSFFLSFFLFILNK
jgi:hypothetical protein